VLEFDLLDGCPFFVVKGFKVRFDVTSADGSGRTTDEQQGVRPTVFEPNHRSPSLCFGFR
jgi:hypothetical protein